MISWIFCSSRPPILLISSVWSRINPGIIPRTSGATYWPQSVGSVQCSAIKPSLIPAVFNASFCAVVVSRTVALVNQSAAAFMLLCALTISAAAVSAAFLVNPLIQAPIPASCASSTQPA